MSNVVKRCKCAAPKLTFKLFPFTKGTDAYRGVCVKCGFVRGWYSASNYKLVQTDAGISPRKEEWKRP